MTDTRSDTSPEASPAAEADAPANGMVDALSGAPAQTAEPIAAPRSAEPPPSFVKLAMRNMVRKGRQSLVHFGLTALGFTVFMVFVAWLGRPHLPQ